MFFKKFFYYINPLNLFKKGRRSWIESAHDARHQQDQFPCLCDVPWGHALPLVGEVLTAHGCRLEQELSV